VLSGFIYDLLTLIFSIALILAYSWPLFLGNCFVHSQVPTSAYHLACLLVPPVFVYTHFCLSGIRQANIGIGPLLNQTLSAQSFYPSLSFLAFFMPPPIVQYPRSSLFWVPSKALSEPRRTQAERKSGLLNLCCNKDVLLPFCSHSPDPQPFFCLSALILPILNHFHKGSRSFPFTSLSISIQPDNVMVIRPFKQPHIGEAVSQCLISVLVKRTGCNASFIQPCPKRLDSFGWHTAVIIHIQSAMVNKVCEYLHVPGDNLPSTCRLPVIRSVQACAEFLERRQIFQGIGKRTDRADIQRLGLTFLALGDGVFGREFQQVGCAASERLGYIGARQLGEGSTLFNCCSRPVPSCGPAFDFDRLNIGVPFEGEMAQILFQSAI
jgi:hypothetical protein